MFHPDKFFTDPSYPDASLKELQMSFLRHLETKSKPVKAPSKKKYEYSLDALFRNMEAHGTPLTLRYLHPETVETWMADYRATHTSEGGLCSALSAIKVFANGFIYRERDLTVADPLRKIKRFEMPEQQSELLSLSEMEQCLEPFKGPGYTNARNIAGVYLLISTGMRLRELAELQIGDVDFKEARILVHGKNGKDRFAGINKRLQGYLKNYLKLRPTGYATALWLCDDGSPFKQGGWTSVLARLKKSSGVSRARAHLFRHSTGSHWIDAGYEIARVQDMLGHETPYMTKRYTRKVRAVAAAETMRNASPI
jgi:site-specific recombinase XerD